MSGGGTDFNLPTRRTDRRTFVLESILSACAGWMSGCRQPATRPDRPVLTMICGEEDRDFTQRALDASLRGHAASVQAMPTLNSMTFQLSLYRDLFERRLPRPDICEIDVIWPAMLADHLVDLAPYVGDGVQRFDPMLIRNYTIDGRLVALPLYIDSGLLYYRTDLLRKYGFAAAPETWAELEHMARKIQAGERKRGKDNFWGYIWQGSDGECLTCNGLEWQVSEGGGTILGANGRVEVRNERFQYALERATAWVGTISPPGIVEYDEDDCLNLWLAGNAAFMRNWVYCYGLTRKAASPVHARFGVALLPAGSATRARTLGGVAMAVSKYSRYREEAAAGACYLTSEAAERERALATGSVPTRPILYRDAAALSQTPFSGPLSGRVTEGLVARPSRAAGRNYDAVSRAYAHSIHSALTKECGVAAALAQMEKELLRITG
jgi:trehalose/maltose transport system substrate-binding protein